MKKKRGCEWVGEMFELILSWEIYGRTGMYALSSVFIILS